jgi:hypothetical protein
MEAHAVGGYQCLLGPPQQVASSASTFVADRHCRGGPFLLVAGPLTHNRAKPRN